ncbi:hypothetical protein QIS99_12015 [Streptomyces sp. B-S-A8]|uniref:Uncharacterized protein n=1 Tax=Streptomyces solicavernae TaxID=3043614 RepID=A0ABT6RTA5_9ACTN|nr:hypothetical protein [Streptomyces sp. B-S-A8]MDI3386921.1 hypothetical protein [Streptomyces sp. B-S-A8]
MNETSAKFMPSDRQVISAATAFVDAWQHLAPTLTYDYECHLQCSEANTLAELFRAFGRQDVADEVIAAHAEHDEPGDSHYVE